MTTTTLAKPMFVRARLVRDLCEAARALDAARFGALVEHAEQALAHAEQDWIPADGYFALHEGIYAVGGPQALVEVSRRSLRITQAGPPLSGLVRLAQRVLNQRPFAVLRWFPAARTMILRGFGEATVTEEGGEGRGAVVQIRGCARVSLQTYQLAHEGILRGLLEVAGCDGDITVQNTGDEVTFRIHWWPATSRTA